MEKKDLIKVVIAGVLILVAVILAVSYFTGGSAPTVTPEGEEVPAPRVN